MVIRVQKTQFNLEKFTAAEGLNFDTGSPFLSFKHKAETYTRFYDKAQVEAWDVIGPEDWVVQGFINKGEDQ